MYKPDSLIHVYEPFVAKNQRKYILDVLDSNIFSFHSPYVERFEKQLAEYLKVKHVISTFNGSVSLMLILKALGIGRGDEVITQNLTYAATVSSIINVGAMPVIIDSTLDLQMDISLVEGAIGSKTKAVMVAGLYGNCANVKDLKEICDRRGILLIEDAAEVFGSDLGGKKLGTLGVAGSYSFFSNKIITTSEGGAVVTDDDTLGKELRLLRGQSHIGGFIHSREGYNFRLTGFQGALGCAQLEEVEEVIVKKRFIASYYRDNLTSLITSVYPKVNSSEWMQTFFLPDVWDYKSFMTEMLKRNIETRPCFTPISLMPGFEVIKGSELSVSESVYKQGFNLPASPTLREEQLDYIKDSVANIFRGVAD